MKVGSKISKQKDVVKRASNKSNTKIANPKATKRASSAESAGALSDTHAVRKEILKLERGTKRLKDQIATLKKQLSDANEANRTLQKRIINQSILLRRKKDQNDLLFPNIPDIILDDDNFVKFAVEAAARYQEPEWAVVRYTNTESSAREVADILALKHGCVRLSERGSWLTKQGQRKSGFVAFWWSDAEYVGEKPQNRGYGIPSGKMRPIEYAPLHP